MRQSSDIDEVMTAAQVNELAQTVVDSEKKDDNAV
jgi:hypothetical protein